MRRITLIVVHCSATKPSQDIGVSEIRTWHMRDNGWSDVGYHYVIRRDGSVETGRPEAVAGAHAKGHNQSSIGVCLVGGLDEQGRPAPDYTDAQWQALRTTLDALRERYPEAVIVGHRDLPGVAKACPSFDVQAWLRPKPPPPDVADQLLPHLTALVNALVTGRPSAPLIAELRRRLEAVARDLGV